MITEEEMIEYAKPILKELGFKKKGKRWTRVEDGFTCVFFIQGNLFDKDDFYVRPGVFINDMMHIPGYYGHIFIDIKKTTPEEIMEKALSFFKEFTDKKYLKVLVQQFAFLEKNPAYKRRACEGVELLVAIHPAIRKYIDENY